MGLAVMETVSSAAKGDELQFNIMSTKIKQTYGLSQLHVH